MLAESVGSTGDGGGGAAEDYILIRDEKASGGNGGGSTAGSWIARVLNTIVDDAGNHASLASNQITLAAGTYRIKAHAPGYKIANHKIKLRNITDASDVIIGSSEYSASPDNTGTRSFLDGRFTIASPKVLELQYRCVINRSTDGLGRASGFAVVEVYAVIEFWKEA